MYKNNSLLYRFHEVIHCTQQHEFVFFACGNKENTVNYKEQMVTNSWLQLDYLY